MISKKGEPKLVHRSFRLTIELGDRKLKPHLQTAEWSLDLFGLACTLPAVFGVYLAIQHLAVVFLVPLLILATVAAWFVTRRLISRLYVFFDVFTARESRDYWSYKNGVATGYPESWLEPLDDASAVAGKLPKKNTDKFPTEPARVAAKD